jgi:hypothetical protein
VPSKSPIDKISDQLKLFEIRYANKIAKLFDTAINDIDNNNNNNKNGKEDDADGGGGEFEEVEAPQYVYHAEAGKAWEQYLKKHGVVIDYTNPKNSQDSEYIWTLYQTFCDEWDKKQPHQKKIMIRVKKRWTEEEKTALREEIKKKKEEAAKHCFGFKD